MTSPAALPGAAVRVLRTEAGRRALQLAVLVGGLIALGFLCGEQAHAAEGTPAVTSTTAAPSVPSVPSDSPDGVRALTRGVAKGVTKAVVHDLPHAPATSVKPPTPVPASHAVTAHAPVSRGSVDSVPRESATGGSLTEDTGNVVRSVTGGVVKPVADLVGSVTRSFDEALDVTAPLSDAPLLPGTGSTVPLPGLSELPGTLLPAPVVAQPVPSRPGGVTTPAQGSGHTTAAETTTVAHEPVRTPAAPVPDPALHAHGHRVAHHGHAPSRPVPTGDPDGSLGGQSALDNGGPRHADAHAVTLNDRAPLRLAPGTAARDDAAGTRDRHRDIPVFPG